MKADELIKFLMWAEQIHRPRTRLCEQQQLDGDEFDSFPIFQTIGWKGNKLGNDAPGQEGIRALVEEYDDWCNRMKENRARPLITAIEKGELTYADNHYNEDDA